MNTQDEDRWGLELCDRCMTMTNHDDDGCLRCRAANVRDVMHDPKAIKKMENK